MNTKKEKLDKSKIIGKGWQYTVYDLGNGKVYKRFNSKWESFKIIFRDRAFIFWKIPALIKEMRDNATKSFEFLETINLNNELLGNFSRVNQLDYKQDKAVPLQNYLKNCTEKEARIIIDKFVILVSTFYRKYHFMDKAMKFGKNFGINSQGDVILIDIGELWFKSNSKKKRICRKIWKSDDSIEDVPDNLRKYYISEMDKIFLS